MNPLASWGILLGAVGLVVIVACALAISFALCSDWLNRRQAR